MPAITLLNVNFPNLSLKKIKGIKICRQANAKWEEEFDERVDPRKRPYYWLTGKFKNYDKGDDTDEWAMKKWLRFSGAGTLRLYRTSCLSTPEQNKLGCLRKIPCSMEL